MFVSVANYTPRLSRNRVAHVLCVIFAFALLYATHLSAQTVATYDFEDGTADGWISFNGASTPVATNAAADSGLVQPAYHHQLRRRRRPLHPEQAFCCPGQNTLSPAFAKLTPGEAATDANFTIKRTDPGCSGGTCYDTVGPFQVARIRFRLGADRRQLHRQHH